MFISSNRGWSGLYSFDRLTRRVWPCATVRAGIGVRVRVPQAGGVRRLSHAAAVDGARLKGRRTISMVPSSLSAAVASMPERNSTNAYLPRHEVAGRSAQLTARKQRE